MNRAEKSFLVFLKLVYTSFYGHVILLTVAILIPMIYVAYLYSPTDFRAGTATFNSWWIVLIGMTLWTHMVGYLFWRDIQE